jgi:hypothetical protein
MGYNTEHNDVAIGNGGAGTAKAWDIINDTYCDLEGRTVSAFMSMDENGGTFTAMEEETTKATAPQPAVSEPVAARYLTYTYPQYVIFEGRYTKLTATRGCAFKVWFLK